MEVAAKLPLTLEERLKLGEELRIPASWEDFLGMYHRNVAEGTTFYTHNDG
jgi:hypothetical protein